MTRDDPTSEGSGDAADATGRGLRPGRWLAGVTVAATVYWTLLRPRMLHWGATRAEVAQALPGDDLLPDATAESTMAITVDAPTNAVWPWLRQLGQDRGGFYSYEWAENLVGLDIHNADEILLEHQSLSVGDRIRLARADRFPEATLEVAALDPERSLVLEHTAEPTGWVWSFVLDPVDETTTRLLVRSRVRLPDNPLSRVAARTALDPVTFVMTRGMLRGIRARAEDLAMATAAPATGPGT
jgi:hypothetical protein